jgi:LysR family glycine cleavage system transcriptional activator
MNAMRAFEAAARHGSFFSAANELCVTAGAVAQQVKSMEARETRSTPVASPTLSTV